MRLIAGLLLDGDIADIGFYALLGMRAMMGASLQAPLAALTVIMELTYNLGIIMSISELLKYISRDESDIPKEQLEINKDGI